MLLFLHADTRLPGDAADAHRGRRSAAGACWGRFDVRIDGRPALAAAWSPALMNLRSRWTGIATGDQAMFVTRELFERIGGFPDQPLMEDIELSRRLRALAPPGLPARARASPRAGAGSTRGVWRTIVLMWRLRWRYWRGAPADAAGAGLPVSTARARAGQGAGGRAARRRG